MAYLSSSETDQYNLRQEGHWIAIDFYEEYFKMDFPDLSSDKLHSEILDQKLISNLSITSNFTAKTTSFLKLLFILIILGSFYIFLIKYSYTRITKHPRYVYSLLLGLVLYVVPQLFEITIESLVKESISVIRSLEVLIPPLIFVGLYKIFKRSIKENEVLAEQITIASSPLLVLLGIDLISVLGSPKNNYINISLVNVGFILGISIVIIILNLKYYKTYEK